MNGAAKPLLSPKLDLILAAEKLFGTYGIEGVSLRRVSERAGNRNVFAAQYHFGSKDNLLEAILRYRRPLIDVHRRILLHEWGVTPETAALEQIVRVLATAMFEQDSHDPEQARSFCRFLRSLLQFEAYSAVWERSIDAAPLTAELLQALRAHLPHLDEALWVMRRLTLGKFMMASLADYDRDELTRHISPDRFLDDIVNVVVAGYRAPPPACPGAS